jgi:hypothetical protein
MCERELWTSIAGIPCTYPSTQSWLHLVNIMPLPAFIAGPVPCNPLAQTVRSLFPHTACRTCSRRDLRIVAKAFPYLVRTLTLLGSIGPLLPAGVSYQALRDLPRRGFQPREQHVLQDAPSIHRYSSNRNVYILPSWAPACCVLTAPGARKPYSPAPRFGKITIQVRGAIFLASNGTRSLVAPPEA